MWRLERAHRAAACRKHRHCLGGVDRAAAAEADDAIMVALLHEGHRRIHRGDGWIRDHLAIRSGLRSEEHTSELQSLMRISYAVFCLKKKKTTNTYTKYHDNDIHKVHTLSS